MDENQGVYERTLTNALPGLVVLFLGVIGLILMLVKVPIREVLLSDHEKSMKTKCQSNNSMCSVVILPGRKLESDKISLPVFWTLQLYKKLTG